MTRLRGTWSFVAGVVWVGTLACSGAVDEGEDEVASSGGDAQSAGSGGAQEPDGSGGVVSSGGTSSGGAVGGTGGVPAEVRCSQDPFVYGTGGWCGVLISKYSFNAETGACEQFSYSGCNGNDNNFDSLAACEAACVPD